MRKRLFAILLVFVLVCSLLVPMQALAAPGPVITKQPEGAFYADAVAWAIANGITAGTSETTFSPYRPCSRAEIVTFLWRAAGCPEPVSGRNPFSDVPEGAYYTDAVLWAVENGITTGTSDTAFSPADTCNRAQIVTFLWRAAGCPEPDGAQDPFDDVAAGSWYEKAVRWAVENGITLGTSDTSFSPADPCSRAQAVTMLYRGRSVRPGHRIFPEEEFGGVYINLTIDAFNALGYEYGDSVDVTFSNGYSLKGIPYYNGYYTQTGEPLLVAYPGYPYIKACINNGDDLWVLAGLDESDRAEIRLAEKGAYLDIQNARDIHYKDDRSLFDSDEMFANFRSVQSAHIKENMLYRSASPCDNQHNRAPYSDRLIAQDSVKYIVNLADNEAKIQKYISGEGFDSPYFLSLYESGNVIALALNTNFTASPDGEDDPVPEMPLNLGSPEFRSKTAKGLIAMTEHEGPYLIHCTEGKDRTGFICLLLEALCGASYDEIVDDYMITYYNYYRITRETDPDRYDVIVENVLVPMIRCLTEDGVDPAEADLAGCAENYLLEAGMNIEQISALRSILGR